MKRVVELEDPIEPELRPIRHFRNLLWWGAIALAALIAIEASSTNDTPKLYERSGPGVESEGFLALRLPRVRGEAETSGGIDAAQLAAVLEQLEEGGHSTLHFRDVEAFYRHGTPLPRKPLLLAVPEGWRETVDALDGILAETGQRAVLFVDVAEVARVNLSLASRVRLAELAASGRWEVGIATCMHGPGAGVPTPEALGLARRQLQEWTGMPVRAADCRSALGDADEREAWFRTAREAGLSVAFVRGRAATNYRIDFPLALQSIPVDENWRSSDVEDRLHAFLPRREPFEDDFDGSSLEPSWVVDAGEARDEDGAMIVTNGGRQLGLVRLGGTENWRDARVEVTLETPPIGQFWIFLRRQGTEQFVRLGRIGDEILLQRSHDGDTRQLARVAARGDEVTLGFEIVGNRVEALVDGRRLDERPHAIPSSLAFGPVSLAVWNEEGEARARVASFSAKPLPRLAALISPDPSSAEWSALRKQANDLTELSPRSFRWTENGGETLAEPDSGLVIFAHFHRLSLRPAVSLSVDRPADDYSDLAEQILEWAADPAYDGVNLLVHRQGDEEPPRRLLATLLGLEQAMRKQGKELSITFVGAKRSSMPPTLLPWAPFWGTAEASASSFAVVRAG